MHDIVFSMNIAGAWWWMQCSATAKVYYVWRHPPVPPKSDRLSCADSFAWSRGCPFVTSIIIRTVCKWVHKYVLFEPSGRNSTAIITKIAGYLRIRILMNRWFFCIFWIGICWVTASLRFFSWNTCGYAQTAAVENKHYITIGDRRLRTVAEATGLWDAESIIFNRGRRVVDFHG